MFRKPANLVSPYREPNVAILVRARQHEVHTNFPSACWSGIVELQYGLLHGVAGLAINDVQP